MATDNEQVVADKLKKEAEKVDKQIRSLVAKMRTIWVDAAKLYAKMRTDELWKYLTYVHVDEVGVNSIRPCESLDRWRESVGVSRSSFYDTMRIYDNLAGHITEDQMKEMSQENARTLGLLPAECRSNAELLEKAKKLKNEDFVLVANESKSQHPATADAPENRVVFKFRCYESQYEFITEQMQEFAKRHDLAKDDYGRILELMTAELAGNVEKEKSELIARLAGAFRKNLERMTFIENVLGSDKPADEQLQEVSSTVNYMKAELSDATKGFGTEYMQADWAAQAKTRRAAASAAVAVQ